MDIDPVIVDVASDWGGCSDERLRRAFASAVEWLWGVGPPPAEFLETGELELTREMGYRDTGSGLARIAMAVRAYLPVEAGTALQWHRFGGRYCLRLVASDREDEPATEMFRRYAGVLPGGAAARR